MSLPFLFFTFFLPTFSPFLIFLCKEDAANKFSLLFLARLGRRYDRLGYFNYSSRWKNVRLVNGSQGFFGTWPRLRMSRFSTFVFSFGIQGGSTTGRCSNPDDDDNIDDVLGRLSKTT